MHVPGVKMQKHVEIGGVKVSASHPPFIIAEMSGNHNGSLARALEIVDAIADTGAQALKLQTYTADTITIDFDGPGFTIDDPKSLWSKRRLYELYQEAHTPWEWHKPIFDRARQKGMVCFSSAFDHTSVDFLMSLGTDCIKIASFENNDIPLLRKAASTGKPVIISSGTADRAGVDRAISTLRAAGAKEIVLLKCTSAYPASPTDSNLLTIPDMQKVYDLPVGLSDHTMGIGAAVASIALGACVVEKHVTLKRDDGGVDSAFSLEPDELKSLVVETRRAWESLGKVTYDPTEKERNSLLFKRSIYVVADIAEGEVLTEENIRSIRPSLGLDPQYWDDVIGKRAVKSMTRGTPLSKDMVTK